LTLIKEILTFRVDFVDSFGRTRRCQKKDLAEFRRRDRQPESPDRTTPAPTPTTYGNFVPSTDAGAVDAEGSSAQADVEAERKRLLREQWAKDDEINRSKTSLHYQDVLYQGAPSFALISTANFICNPLVRVTMYLVTS